MVATRLYGCLWPRLYCNGALHLSLGLNAEFAARMRSLVCVGAADIFIRIRNTVVMNDATHTQLRPWADTSPSAIVAGFIAMMTGYTSSLVLMFQAGQAAGLTTAQISSWIWAISIGMAVCSIGLSLR